MNTIIKEMTTELKNFIMVGSDAEGNDYEIQMTALETELYKDIGDSILWLYKATAVWEQACERVGIEFCQVPDMITEETA